MDCRSLINLADYLLHQTSQYSIAILMYLGVLALSSCSESGPVNESVTVADQFQVSTEDADNKLIASETTVPASLNGSQAFAACASCHSLAEGAEHKVGPNLFGIVGSAAARHEDFPYSPALQESSLMWTRENLSAWIINSEILVPNSWMLYQNILTVAEVSALLDYLENEAESMPENGGV
ncbi:MAG: c-type cytochrome [Gammaproteobacteria bacterium]|nr:c-type cytochrome [Gammaproteobacteria bacterium]MCY4357026.1 c-type cytochrome [Gammaproteobacteria bacterium]